MNSRCHRLRTLIRALYLNKNLYHVVPGLSSPVINISKQVVLVDEPFRISLQGFKPRDCVTITSEVTEKETTFYSIANFATDADGCVCLDEVYPEGGFYHAKDSMGLIWSMRQLNDNLPGLRLLKYDVTTPQTVVFKVYPGCLDSESLKSHQGSELVSSSVQRWFKAPSVRRIPVESQNIVGTLFVPESGGRFPGVLDLFGTAGGLMEMKAALLASKGFVTLALAYFNHPGLPTNLADVSLDYFHKAVEFLSQHPAVSPGGVGVYGISKGAELAQLLALHDDKVKAVVSVNGAPYVTMHSVKHRGSKIPVAVEVLPERLKFEDGKLIFKNFYVLDPTNIFPLWEKEVQLLSICGDNDLITDPEVQQLQYDTYPAEHKHKISLVRYPGTGHIIDPPYCPMTPTAYHKVYRMEMCLGGQPKDHNDAQIDAWHRITRFFHDTLPQQITGNMV